MHTDIIELSLVISVYQCPLWFNKTFAVVFTDPLLYQWA